MASELWIIRAKIFNSQISLKEVKELWFEAKKILGEVSQPEHSDIEAAVGIFNHGIERVSDFFSKWLDGKVQPTNEELDLLEEAFNEASWAFNFLETNAPNTFSPGDSNEKCQERIKENKKIIGEEKNRRKKVEDLQSKINFFRNQPNNSDNEAKIKDLQRQIEELKKNKPPSPPVPNPEVPRQSTPSISDENNNSLI